MTSVASDRLTIAARQSARALALDAETAVWLVLIPCAIVTIAAIVLLGPPLGERILAPRAADFWPGTFRRPEPTEDARYLIALGGPILLALATWNVLRRPPPLGRRTLIAGVVLAQLLTAAFVAAAVVGQHRAIFVRSYFTPATLAAAAAIAGLALVAIVSSRERVVRWRTAWLSDTPRRRRIAVGAAIAFTAIWMLHAVISDRVVAWTNSVVAFHVQFTLDETFAVLNGLTPLVNFSAQYGSLWPFVAALPMVAFGKTLLVFTLTMCTISAVSLLAVFDVLRRASRSALAGLLLFLPFVATTLFRVWGTPVDLLTYGSYFGMLPLRYGGPFLLAGVTARHLDRVRPRSAWPVFVVAGLVAMNNLEFGIAALGASVTALLWTTVAPRWRSLARFGASVAGGLLGAYALVSILTLARAGALPQLERLSEFDHVYLLAGFNLIPLPSLVGLHLVIYATYVAAIGAASVRALRREPNRVLTGMLAWSGVFGLGAANYYVGRSGSETLLSTFSAWALALMLLTVVAVQATAARPARRPTLAALLVLFGFGVMACSIAQTPTPWGQIRRLQGPPAGAPAIQAGEPNARGPLVPDQDPETRRFVSSLADGPHRFVVKRGAPIAILTATGHRVADAYGVVNVDPYTGMESIQLRSQFEDMLDRLRDAGGNTVLIGPGGNDVVYRLLSSRGFEVVTGFGLRRWRPHDNVTEGISAGGLMKWVDMRHLHPAALR